MASKTSICNLALIRLGQKAITDADTPQNSPTARKCYRIYDQALDEALAAGPEKGWKFANGRSAVAVSAVEPDSEFDYQYAIPTNVLRITSVMVGDVELTDWVREGDFILTNMEDEEVDMKYVLRITDEAKYPPHFIKVLAMMLAIELAYNLIQSSTHAERLILELQEKIMPTAIAADSQEMYVEESNNDWQEKGH